MSDVTVKRSPNMPPLLQVRSADWAWHVSPEMAAALVAALLSDPEVHALWLHGRKP